MKKLYHIEANITHNPPLTPVAHQAYKAVTMIILYVCLIAIPKADDNIVMSLWKRSLVKVAPALGKLATTIAAVGKKGVTGHWRKSH